MMVNNLDSFINQTCFEGKHNKKSVLIWQLTGSQCNRWRTNRNAQMFEKLQVKGIYYDKKAIAQWEKNRYIYIII